MKKTYIDICSRPTSFLQAIPLVPVELKIFCNNDGTIANVGANFMDFFGFPSDDWLEQDVTKLMPDPDNLKK